MNLVEIWLKEIISAKSVRSDEYPHLSLVEVDAIWNCYGDIRRRQQTFLLDEWEEIKVKGYYLG